LFACIDGKLICIAACRLQRVKKLRVEKMNKRTVERELRELIRLRVAADIVSKTGACNSGIAEIDLGALSAHRAVEAKFQVKKVEKI
jgi:hypothetical protein